MMASASSSKPRAEETDSDVSRSDVGGLFGSQAAAKPTPAPVRGGVGVSAAGVTRGGGVTNRVIGRGEIPTDKRKFRYDRIRAQGMPALAYGASRADRMDAFEAGEKLESIHKMCGIARETEDIIAAFDKALFLEHALNGASLMQPGRGRLYVGKGDFDLQLVKNALSVDQRRFFRAFADDVADVLRETLAAYDAYDPESVEKHGQIMQLAVERGLQKYPYLVHDSSDAGVRLSLEERVAVAGSKKLVLPTASRAADKLVERTPAN